MLSKASSTRKGCYARQSLANVNMISMQNFIKIFNAVQDVLAFLLIVDNVDMYKYAKFIKILHAVHEL